MSKKTYHHINPKAPGISELEEIGKDLVIEIINIHSCEYELDCQRIEKCIAANDFMGILRNSHSLVSKFKLFFDYHNPVMQSLYEFERLAQQKSREHLESDFVKNDVNFHEIFSKLKVLLKDPVEEIKALGEEFKRS
ncbi:MAG: hypothetical protein K9H16_06385 [Bacteroidales bacterium]|nr:hypothetical protein [Bacteroidales bacterium]